MAEGIVLQNGGGGGASDELTATAANVLAGRTYVGADTEDEAGAGTMPDNGAMQRVLRAGENIPIPEGYHNGSGTVRAAPLAEQTPGNATAGDILRGKTTWSNGGRVDGSIPIIDTMGNGDGRGNNSPWFGIDGNNQTFWVELLHRVAYYTRSDGKPHVTIDAAALGNAIKEQVLQGARFSCQYGINVEGTIPTWHASGDIGGQKVIDAFQSAAFAGDYGVKGRGVFMRILGGVYTEPGTMWCFAPANTILPHNIREGVPILGTFGTMKDYAASCVPFDGAHFDGTHISGWASGSFRYPTTQTWKPLQVGDFGYTGISSQSPSSYNLTWAFTPTVHLGAFRRVRITAFIDIRNCQFVYRGGVRGYAAMSVSFMRIVGGNQGARIVHGAGAATGGFQQHDAGVYQFDIPVETFNEPVVIMVNADISQVQRIPQKDALVRAGVSRVELIA
jgi:putative phage tail fiber protein